VHKVFDIKTLPGLSNHFIGECDLESIIKPTVVPNLSIVTCGLIPPNPSEMLGSQSMETFCKNVGGQFDTIIFDTPPAMAVTDAIVLSNIVNGVVYVIKAGEVPKEAVKRSILQLSGRKSEILGVVMNSVDVSMGSYYHYYSRYYKYGYVNLP
jgi:tyrosine-protein kinase Etk/Wzc